MAEENIHETLGELKAKAKAAHERIDRLEDGLREDLRNFTEKLGEIEKWMHKTQGWAAASLFIGTLLGSVISLIIKHFL